ncbi:MAG TPA: TonB-dependent receptor [Vicinamibacterales bacterium]|nr:TonB-dependent receptor [Vicinamibacterales bacterium]
MSIRRRFLFVLLMIAMARTATAQVFGSVRIVVRDQQNLAVADAEVTVKAKDSAWSQTAKSNEQGEALFITVPFGTYVVSVTSAGFDVFERDIQVISNTQTPVQVRLAVAGLAQSVDVKATAQTINPESSGTQTLTSREDILLQPLTDRSGSLAMITNNVPGTFVMHDHLHSRGGHGVTWQIDGVPVPNSNLASSGAQFDPKDVASLETQRGGLSANYGDRAYGVFNVVPRSGFEDDRFGELFVGYGSYHRAEGYASVGDHNASERFAYFASGNANRTDLGLERVDLPILHDEGKTASGFTSLQYNATSRDHLRVVASFRADRNQVPNIVVQEAQGIDDSQRTADGIANFTWAHTYEGGTLLTVSPYYHYNRGQYIGGPNDPLITHDDRSSHYVGGNATLARTIGQHTLRIGTDSFGEHWSSLFGLTSTTGAQLSLTETERLWATVLSAFAEDTFRVTPSLTINSGVRFERFAGTLTEYGLSPRFGVAIALAHGAVVRASYGRFYQHPQVATVSGPVLEFALRDGFDILPIPGERDQIWEVGYGIPVRGWTLDFDAFYNQTRNAVDHEVLGNSNLLFPLTIESGRVRAFESTLRSPRLWNRVQWHYAFSLMRAQGRGAITGGLTDFSPPSNDYFYLDHDQLVTLNTGAEASLPGRFWVSLAVQYGSGFLLGDGPDHLSPHTTLDVAGSKNLTDDLSVRLTVTNLANAAFLTGYANSFAGTHYQTPREIVAQMRYRFHY